jgi:hypothetical protein
MLKNDGVRLFTGVVFSNVAVAMLGDVLDAGAYFLGPNTSPNDYAGRLCDPHYFVTGWDETLHASAGVLANRLGKQTIFLLAPNYLTGKQVIAAVKSTFAGTVVGEIYTGLDQTDFSADPRRAPGCDLRIRTRRSRDQFPEAVRRRRPCRQHRPGGRSTLAGQPAAGGCRGCRLVHAGGGGLERGFRQPGQHGVRCCFHPRLRPHPHLLRRAWL